MNVLSLCDGMSIAHIALDKLGYKVDKYYAAEIKPIAIKVTKDNYPDTIHIGDVNKVRYKGGILYTEFGNYNVGKIDLMVFGSPCQSFSRCMKTDMRVGLEDKTRSGLFFECYRILQEVNPTWWLLENVASMKNEDRDYLTECMGVEPIRINSKLVCAALRDRYYWTNIPGITQPEDKGITLQSILTSGWTDREKARTLLVSDSRPLRDKQKMLHRYKKFTTLVWEERGNDESIRYLNQTELERCQTVPEGYTKCLTRNEAADVLGDAFTVDVIAHIFSFINTQQKDLKEVNN
jgi:site-specific DNA-cytosine methylase